MQHTDYVTLLRGAVPTPGGVWADFGSGQGAYTLALAELIGPGSTIYSVDRDASGLAVQAKLMAERFPQVQLKPINADFTMPVQPALPKLDGLLIANALHLVPSHQKAEVIKLLKSYLKPGGRMVVVDYNGNNGNSWVPYPQSFANLEPLARQAGFETVRQVSTYPSNFLKEFFSAELVTPQPPPPPPPAPAAAAVKKPAPVDAKPTAKKVATKKKAAPPKSPKA
jgi:SAM-dependent methyltransferase